MTFVWGFQRFVRRLHLNQIDLLCLSVKRRILLSKLSGNSN
jgi:hypothetical protein